MVGVCRVAEHQDIQPHSACGESFHCANSGGCIDPSQVCDFHEDCPLGEDEGSICGEDFVFISKIKEYSK